MMKTKLFIISLLFLGCNSNQTGSLEMAQEEFIKESQIMTKEDALSKEISYYKEPQITVSRKVRDLTGKDVIHECNLLLKENAKGDEALRNGTRSVVGRWNVGDVKAYAVGHPDDIIGAEYYFEGDFVHYNNGSSHIKAKVLLMNGAWYVLRRY